jgi:ATP-dependent helicase/nuclease subunit A
MSAPSYAAGEIPKATRAAQARASDPKASAWVSANAGSGKTHVLAQRVLRLLLGGAPPSRILCLTFTKAAAANMAERVFKTLAQWTRLSDEALGAAIVKAGAAQPDAARLAFARRLFARAIETPGGLKIQTIHAFCERLLHLFPFEANVAAGFRVIEERDAARLLARAQTDALAALSAEPDDERRLAALAREAGADGFDRLLREALGLRGAIADAVAYWGDVARYGEALAASLGLAPGEDGASLEGEMLAGLGGPENWPNIAAQCDLGGKNDNDLAATLREARQAATHEAALKAYTSVFFTKDDKPRGGAERRIVSKPLEARFPGLLARLRAEQDRLVALGDKRKAAQTLDRSLVLLGLVHAILAAYARLKAKRGLLDFDDLIERTLALLTRSDAAWVLYKLDSGVDHILVDEAQDTSKEQWEILKRLAEDFTSGKGAREAIRTFFAVGDEKQSIYSFQGAAPRMFAEMRREFAKRHRGAKLEFAEVPLHLSFRSAAKVLEGVDRIFSVPQTWSGVADDEKPPPHEAFRAALPGLVEIWEPIEGASGAASDSWLMPLDAPSSQDPPVQLARRIAGVIGDWLSPGSPDRVHDAQSGGPRRIAPGDIMILVRSRGAFFEAMIRALKEANVKAAGADRLALSEHIATMDLVSAGRAALLPEDDLALACVLKSPLLGLNDDDLIALAPRREGSLAQALGAVSHTRFAQAGRRLEVWRDRARDHTPFAFYARLLGEDGGRRAILSRLGPEAGDAIDEFLSLALAHERDGAPSLANFLDEIEGADVSVKRDMEASGDSVRVMTVHAAKGLEASIVFLPDTCSGPSGRHDPKLFALDGTGPGDPPLVAWSPRAASDPPTVALARAAVRAEAAGEHRRLLYVAMTRAAERLIVAGFHGSRGKVKDCWHDMARAGLDGATVAFPAPWNEDEQVWRLGAAWREAGGAPPVAAKTRDVEEPWLRARATPERAPPPLNPSRALAPSPATIGAKRKSLIEAGRLSHSLLQYLPEIAADQRRGAARRFLAGRGAGAPAAQREAILERVLTLIDDPRLVALFGANSRAEVAVAANLFRPGLAPTPFIGRIDRVAVGEDGVLIADFKSGAPRGWAPPAPYVAQLALYRAALAPLYPQLPLRAFIVWLDRPDIVEIDPGALDEALDRLSKPASF